MLSLSKAVISNTKQWCVKQMFLTLNNDLKSHVCAFTASFLRGTTPWAQASLFCVCVLSFMYSSYFVMHKGPFVLFPVNNLPQLRMCESVCFSSRTPKGGYSHSDMYNHYIYFFPVVSTSPECSVSSATFDSILPVYYLKKHFFALFQFQWVRPTFPYLFCAP